MIKFDVDNGHIIVDHDCEGKSEKQIAAELVQALDFICADLYVDNPLLNNEEKIGKALETRNNILDQMKNIEYSCEEYFETDGEIERVPYNKECNYKRTYFKAQRITDGEWVEGCLVYDPNVLGFPYIIPFDEVNDMRVKEDKMATVKVIRVMEKSIELVYMTNIITLCATGGCLKDSCSKDECLYPNATYNAMTCTGIDLITVCEPYDKKLGWPHYCNKETCRYSNINCVFKSNPKIFSGKPQNLEK